MNIGVDIRLVSVSVVSPKEMIALDWLGRLWTGSRASHYDVWRWERIDGPTQGSAAMVPSSVGGTL